MSTLGVWWSGAWLVVAACGSDSRPQQPPVATSVPAVSDAPTPQAAEPAPGPAPDFAAYRAALETAVRCPRGSSDSATCVQAAYRKAMTIWPDGLAAARLAVETNDGALASRALFHVVDVDERIPLLELVATARERSGDRAGALAALQDRLALRGDSEVARRAERLAGSAAPADPAERAIPLAGPYRSLDQYCEALTADAPIHLHTSKCLPACTGVDDGPTTATAGGLEARLLATIEESDAVAGSAASCDVAIRGADGWYVFHDAFDCARCGHAAFPEGALGKLTTRPGILGTGRYASAPRFEAASSEELAFRDVVPGGVPELVVTIRLRVIYTEPYDETRNDIIRDDTHALTVCGAGPSKRWSCEQPRTIANASELMPLHDRGERSRRTARTAWTATVTLADGHLALRGVKQNGARPSEDIQLQFR